MEWKQTMTTSTYSMLEEEIKKAFEQADQYETRPALILSLLPLKPIEEMLFKKYKTWTGDGRRKFPPMAVMKAMLLKELKGIRSYQQLVAYLCHNPVESRLLGFERFLPSDQTFGLTNMERIDEEIRRHMDFVVSYIRQFSKENGRQLDIDFPAAATCRGTSKRTVQRHVSQEGGRIIRILKKAVLKQLALPENENYIYTNEDLIDALGYMAERQMCANQGCNLMRQDERFKGQAMHGRTLLGRLSQMEEQEILDSYTRFFDAVFKLAQRNGLIPLHPVLSALNS